ncbi:MAG: LysR family transcriptional regulator [Clostridia bacterium]|nr:LysR family transcriptional regulator [Clostridia bacterium]
MTLRHLKIFVCVAESGGMTAAAQKLYVSQPTVSQAIAELEKYYGVRLFERLSQKLYITDDGKKMIYYARHIIDTFNDMENAMRETGENLQLNIGCSVSVGTYLVNRLLDLAEEGLKKCRVNVTVNNTSCIENMLLSNELDIGIVEGIVTNPDLVIIPVCQDNLVLVCGAGHKLAGRKGLSLSDLNGEDFISREKGSTDRNQLERLLDENGIMLNRIWHCSNTEAIKNAVMHGRGLAALSSMMVEKECAEGKLVTLEVSGLPINRTINLLYHKNKYITPSIRVMLDVCEKYEERK